MLILNVGGGPSRYLPAQYDGWTQHLLDIDPAVNPDICLDARLMGSLEADQYDAVFCSHNLEHFYRHEVPQVLAGFMQVLKPDGIVDIVVPNLGYLFAEIHARSHDVDDVWYRTVSGPVTFHDVLYGWSQAMGDGNLYYAHKCGFTALSLHKTLTDAGFTDIQVVENASNLFAKARKCPSP